MSRDQVNNNVSRTKVQKRKITTDDSVASSVGGSGSVSSTKQTLLDQATKIKNTKMNDMRKRKRDLFSRINYTHTLTVVVLPLLSILYLFQMDESIVPENQSTLYFTCIYYNITILAFTSGYHKYFTHNSFKVKFNWLRYYFAIFGSSIGLGSIRWWASLHRAHHHFTDDTERDPYSIKRGVWFAHWGWLLRKPKLMTFYQEFIEQEFPQDQQREPNIIKNEIVLENEESIEFDGGDIDRNNDYYHDNIKDLLIWQEATYFIWFSVTTFVIPVIITMVICQDTIINGILYPGILRMFLAQLSILSTESICHLKNIQVTIPTQPFSDKNSSQNCNNPLISFLTYGQAHQNYHHEFPHDYRSDNALYAYDPTKWFIWTLEKLGQVEELCRTPNNLVIQLRLQQQQLVINRMKSQLNWGTPISKLPKITPKDFKRILNSSMNEDRIYIVIQNIIHDVTPFMDQHPGGVPLLKASHGKDATKAFYGGVYGHSTAAVNLLATMRIGVLDVGNDEEVWRRVVREEGEVVESDSTSQQKQYRSAEAA
ncbi:OLE2 [[Candida] subhashii]|uniref:Acyl-CoA desaturase n=1 Tax=[Candida] subhashii TaxID=561895 RepID=A0A8J5QMA3_9ASCO|nr:OLE2 [[Candida] subhashii]KAG7663146.1 OLE2 [[Candida] subhashii]